jgi:hypothetical protein
MKLILSFGLLLLGASMVIGCGSKEPTNIMENAGDQALIDYDAMIAADNAAMSTDSEDSQETPPSSQ